MSWFPLTCNLIYNFIPFSSISATWPLCYFSDKLGILLPRALHWLSTPLGMLFSALCTAQCFFKSYLNITFSRASLRSSCCCLVSKSYPTLCDLMECSPPGSSVHRISQAGILQWVSMLLSLYLSSLE